MKRVRKNVNHEGKGRKIIAKRERDREKQTVRNRDNGIKKEKVR